jgi:hypothetical protein
MMRLTEVAQNHVSRLAVLLLAMDLIIPILQKCDAIFRLFCKFEEEKVTLNSFSF